MFGTNLSGSVDSYIKNAGSRVLASRNTIEDIRTYGVRSNRGGAFSPGKMYTFEYYTDDEEIYDTRPIVLGLGLNEYGNDVGINLHFIPFRQRLQLVEHIYSAFNTTINAELKSKRAPHPNSQRSLNHFTWDNINEAYGNMINIKYAVRQYRLERMRYPSVLGYQHWYLGIVNDEDNFVGVTKNKAQSKFLNI